MITFKAKFSITVGTCWYTTDTSGRVADLVHYRHLPEPIEGAINEEFVTLWIDLTKDEDELLAEMNKSTRHHVRKAGEYGFAYEAWYPDTTRKLQEFREFFDASAAAKGLLPLAWRDIRAYASNGALDLSRVSAADGTPLVWHGHYRDAGHARQTYTASVFRTQSDPAFRNMVGRANRYHCWEDMLRFKREGIPLYDFGGWYPGTDDQELLAVNFFKEGFGGRVVTTFYCTRAGTLKGRLYLAAAAAKKRLLGR
jgi:hypothetical protein